MVVVVEHVRHTMFKFDQVLWSPQKVRGPPQNVSEYQNIHGKDWKNAKKNPIDPWHYASTWPSLSEKHASYHGLK